jgi:hypothetical protein
MNEPARQNIAAPSGAAGRAGWRAAALFLIAAFLLRLSFGLLSEFWAADELQIFLIGLKYYATGAWPYFGPDVVYTQTQIPGGLQGLLIAAPLWIVAQPEAPYVLLNLLSMGALCLLTWYVGRRVPRLPAWFLWPWVFFSPWTLNFSTHIVNPSYVLTGAVLFFVATFELLPFLTTRSLPRPLSFVLAGFGLLWVYQLHLSFALMVPFVLIVFGYGVKQDWRAALRGAAWFAVGALVAGLTLIPTLLQFGVASATDAGSNVRFVPVRLLRLPDLVARFLSLGSFELPRFLGPTNADRLRFLTTYLWAAPFAMFAGLCGLIQPVILLVELFRKWKDPPEWGVKGVMVGLILMMWVVFAFSVKGPSSHAIYVTFPVVMIYSCSAWARLMKHRAARIVAAALLVSGLVTHAAIAVDGYTRKSFYSNRALVVRAIQEKNDRLLGERRPVTWQAERAK